MAFRPQRIRDPVHNLILFGTGQFEHTLWQVIQTPQFQRLRRIRQLGFSEFVFPGATHTRFQHSIGVFHTARSLMRVIHDHIGGDRSRQYLEHQAHVALAAALVHDVGHGMFSHAFESVGKDLNLPMARHEAVSEQLIRDSEISKAFSALGRGFADDVADLIGRREPGNLYDSVVSSQFDADRLDYMQRDRFMTGIRSSEIDLVWLLDNLEVATVRTGADEESAGEVETLILGPKAALTAESYVLSLFHLYPNVYFHKTTRGAEALFAALMRRLIYLVRNGDAERVGLPKNHAIMRFAIDPAQLKNATALDDFVFWGALPMLADSSDVSIAARSKALRDRRLPRCIDIRVLVEGQMSSRSGETKAAHRARLDLACANIVRELRDQTREDPPGAETILIDRQSRSPYKRYQDSDTPLNRILIRITGKTVTDMAEQSSVIAGAEPFEICRAYVEKGDTGAHSRVENMIRTEVQRSSNVNP